MIGILRIVKEKYDKHSTQKFHYTVHIEIDAVKNNYVNLSGMTREKRAIRKGIKQINCIQINVEQGHVCSKK